MYTAYNSVCDVSASLYIMDQIRKDQHSGREKVRKERVRFDHPDIPSRWELIWNFVLKPVVVYTGLGRLVIVSERKKSF